MHRLGLFHLVSISWPLFLRRDRTGPTCQGSGGCGTYWMPPRWQVSSTFMRECTIAHWLVNLEISPAATSRIASLSAAAAYSCSYAENEQAQLEMPRLILYLANGVFVMSERGVLPKLEEALEGSLVFVPKGQRRVCRTWRFLFCSHAVCF
jgi:hypothetical protein